MWHNIIKERFLSTPSARRATLFTEVCEHGEVISIHALREEGDQMPRLSYNLELIFLSTPSARRATEHWEICCQRRLISIHALREEGDGNAKDEEVFGYQISIHALREEGDRCCRLTRQRSTYFYPRPPRGGRRASKISKMHKKRFLSTPSARRATLENIANKERQDLFLSTPSARRATLGES